MTVMFISLRLFDLLLLTQLITHLKKSAMKASEQTDTTECSNLPPNPKAFIMFFWVYLEKRQQIENS